MPRVGRNLIVVAALLIAFWMIWSRLRFVVFVSSSWWQLILFFAVLAFVIYLVIDHLLNRDR